MAAKILLIDDAPIVADIVGSFVKAKGHDFAFALTSQDGLQKAADFLPDLIILDVQLPDGQGWEVCQKLKDDPRLKNAPILMASGLFRTQQAVAKGLMLGAADYMLKPFKLDLLAAKIEKLLKAHA